MNIELRPLGLGEVLDRTFQLYRARFTLFLGIAAVITILELLWSSLQIGETSFFNHGHWGPERQLITTLTAIGAWAFNFGTAALSTAAINRAVLAIYEGRPVGILAAYRAVRGRWIACVWVNILAFFIAWSPIILIVLGGALSVFLAKSAKNLSQANVVTTAYGLSAVATLLAFPLCVWLSLRYALAIPACIQEQIGGLQALKRSVSLTRGTRARILLLMLVVVVAWLVIFFVLLSPTFVLLVKDKGHIATGTTIYTLAATFLCSTLMKPLFGIGFTLFYYDARIRKEGYDVEWMLEHSTQPESLAASEPVTGAGPTPADTVAG